MGPSTTHVPNVHRDLTPHERQERISAFVLEQGSVDIKVLTDTFEVSQMTIHRDLSELEDRGVLRKVRGGATAQPSNLFESYIQYRMTENLAAKRAIARRALDHVEPGHSVILDDSTTSHALAALLPQRTPLTVITNSLPTMTLLEEQRGIQLIGLGGKYYAPYGAFLGPMTDAGVRSLRANLLFMSTSALADGVLYHQYQEIANLKQNLVRSATRLILMVDHSKFDKAALYRVVPVSEFDLVIVDDGIDPDSLERLREQAVAVEVATR